MPSPLPSLIWVTDHIAVGAAPLSCAQLADLHHQGVAAILNLCDEYCDLPGVERDHGFEVRHLPIPDEHAPDLDALEAALAWLDEAVYLGKKVYIHCKHGIGRTGTVLNAYLLRRGLGHWRAGRILSRLRSKPANFQQWRAVRRYGRAAGKLRVRAPSLEFTRNKHLDSILGRYDSLLTRAEADLQSIRPAADRCGLDNDRCCHGPLSLSLIETLALARAVDRELTSAKRAEVIERAALLPAAPDNACPLLESARCLLPYARPLACRLAGLDTHEADAIRQSVQPELDQLSNQVYQTLCGSPPSGPPASFPLAEAVSGRYAQRFFDLLKSCQLD